MLPDPSRECNTHVQYVHMLNNDEFQLTLLVCDIVTFLFLVPFVFVLLW